MHTYKVKEKLNYYNPITGSLGSYLCDLNLRHRLSIYWEGRRHVNAFKHNNKAIVVVSVMSSTPP